MTEVFTSSYFSVTSFTFSLTLSTQSFRDLNQLEIFPIIVSVESLNSSFVGIFV
ncbi:MAG: hypothetical protein LBQ24_01670 [Candidatus Peribacteria bacterium]|nr:hypothetical protein [Candidatus Peribacteria bacterium]